MSNYNKVNRVLIGSGTNAGTTLPGIKQGDLLLVDEAGAVVATNADAQLIPKHKSVYIAAGIADGIAILSSPIQGNTVSAYEGAKFAAPAQKRVFLGYNGTAGTGIVTDVSTEYRLRLSILDDHRTNGMRQSFGDYFYNGSASSTTEDVIDGIICNYVQKDYDANFNGDLVKLERVSDGTFSALSANAAVVNGSDLVVSTGHGITAPGSYIRIGGATAAAPIYKVAAVIDANTIKLDIPFQGLSNSALLAANIGTIDTPTEFGFKLTGLEQEALLSRGANEPWGRYEWVNYKAYFNEASDTDFTSAALETIDGALDPGNGYWKQVAYEEEQAKGYLGDTSKRRFDDKRINSQVEVDIEYDSIAITHYEVMPGDFQGTYTSPLQTAIYIPKGTDQGLGTGDNFLHVLNGFFGADGSVGFPDITFA
jgi:hypothetical protein